MPKLTLNLISVSKASEFGKITKLSYVVCEVLDANQKTTVFASRSGKLYMLKNKDQVFNNFMERKAQVKNSSNNNLKTLHTDTGGEYVSNHF